MEISVSILKEKNNINSEIDKINNTDAEYIHLDIMDNTFTNTRSFEISEFLTVNTNKKLDVHIMSTNLDYQIKEAIKLNPEIITFHYEANKKVKKYINLIKKENIKVGLAISPETDIDNIEEYINDIDLLLIMSVEPGEGGQEFILDIIKKIKKIDKKRDYLISVDGGINDKTIEYVREYADIVVSGSFITSSDNYQERIDMLR